MLYKEAKQQGIVENLIPVHINKCRCENYYWDWSSDIGDWVRGNKIPERTKRAYKQAPIAKSNYM